MMGVMGGIGEALHVQDVASVVDAGVSSVVGLGLEGLSRVGSAFMGTVEEDGPDETDDDDSIPHSPGRRKKKKKKKEKKCCCGAAPVEKHAGPGAAAAL